MTHKVNEYISEDMTQDDTAVSHCVSAACGAEQKPLKPSDVTTFSEKNTSAEILHSRSSWNQLLKLLRNPPDVRSNQLCYVCSYAAAR